MLGVMVGGGEVRGGEEKRGETRKVREVAGGKTPRHDARSHRLDKMREAIASTNTYVLL